MALFTLTTVTNSGVPVRLTVEPDKYSIPQIYAYLSRPGGSGEERLPCHGWGVRKTGEGLREGVLNSGPIIEIPKAEWEKALIEREDFRDRLNLEDIRLVRVYSRGDRFTIDGYTLSARVDRTTWASIAALMHEVDSSDNEVLLEGDHFTGWLVKDGFEADVERILKVGRENSIFAKHPPKDP